MKDEISHEERAIAGDYTAAIPKLRKIYVVRLDGMIQIAYEPI